MECGRGFMMSVSEVSKPKVDMASLTVPETFTERFKCSKCSKYLRPPIWIICDSGHNVCDICKTALEESNCPGSDKCKRYEDSQGIQNFIVEDMMKVCPSDFYDIKKM